MRKIAPILMRLTAKILIYLTLWVDFCLIMGVLCTGHLGNVKAFAQITVGNCSVTSNTHDGTVFITMISVWTALLALCGLVALHKSDFPGARLIS
jgi:hypothetical protein